MPDFRFPDVNKQYPCVNTGMDMFGSFFIGYKREGTQMYYVCFFTCLVTRTVLLELCRDLSTDCLLMIFRRSVSRRGYPDLIVTDNGKNLVGAIQAMKLKFQRNYKPDNDNIRSRFLIQLRYLFMLIGLSNAYQDNFSIIFVFLKVATMVAKQVPFIHHLSCQWNSIYGSKREISYTKSFECECQPLLTFSIKSTYIRASLQIV